MTPVSVSAPSKFVVLGEHAVVYGKPAITLATNMRFSMRMSRGNELRVNGRPAGPADISPHVDYLFGNIAEATNSSCRQYSRSRTRRQKHY